MTIVIATPSFIQYDDANGAPLNGGLIYTYAAGTLTPRATYTDQGGLTQNANPVVLDSAGRASIWYDNSASYKIIVKDSLGNTIHTDDNIAPFSTVSSTLTTIAANTIVGNNTGATAAPIALTIAQTAALLGCTRAIRRQVFASSGTYTPDASLIYADIRAFGGGGGGGGVSAVAAAAAGGGASGSECGKVVTAATIGASQTVTIGAGGTAGANTGGTGGTGGTTTVGSIVSATGGLGGVGATSGIAVLGGAGQIATLGDFNGTGAPGGNSSGNNNNSNMTTGYGGSSSLGGGALPRAGATQAAGVAGVDNTGGGGSGASAGAGTANVGGVGGKGYVIITEYCYA